MWGWVAWFMNYERRAERFTNNSSCSRVKQGRMQVGRKPDPSIS
jgi:hypothetical protein